VVQVDVYAARVAHHCGGADGRQEVLDEHPLHLLAQLVWGRVAGMPTSFIATRDHHQRAPISFAAALDLLVINDYVILGIVLSSYCT